MVGKIIFFFYLSFFKAIALLPFSLLYAVSDFMYYIIYDVIKYRRRIVRNNLNKSFPEKNHKEILEIEKLFYHHFCDLIICGTLRTASPTEFLHLLQLMSFH